MPRGRRIYCVRWFSGCYTVLRVSMPSPRGRLPSGLRTSQEDNSVSYAVESVPSREEGEPLVGLVLLAKGARPRQGNIRPGSLLQMGSMTSTSAARKGAPRKPSCALGCHIFLQAASTQTAKACSLDEATATQ